MDDDTRQTILRLYIDTKKEVLGRDAGLIFDRLANGFEVYQRSNASQLPRAHLRLHRVETGSLLVDLLAIASNVVTLHDFWEVATGYLQQMAKALEAITSGDAKRRQDIAPADRTALQALNAPVANDDAKQVTLQVVGDNNTIIVINADNSAAISDFLARTKPEMSRPVPIADLRPAARPSWRETEQVRVLSKDEPTTIYATLLRNRKSWMARPEGLRGAQFPIEAKDDIERLLKSPRAASQYTARGYMADGNFVVIELYEQRSVS